MFECPNGHQYRRVGGASRLFINPVFAQLEHVLFSLFLRVNQTPLETFVRGDFHKEKNNLSKLEQPRGSPRTRQNLRNTALV